MQKTLDAKLARILADPGCGDFILADAKDADMAAGMAAPGKSPEHAEGKYRSLAEYRQHIRQNVQQGLLDIMLMSASTSELLTIKERLFDQSPITPAARANDTTDIWLAMGGEYPKQPSEPFRTATLEHIMCGQADCSAGQAKRGADLGLYSITFNNDLERDRKTLESYRQFRLEAERAGFRHFLEVFDPNACGDHCVPPEMLGRFINDQIARTLAGVAAKGRPIFLKVAYHGPAAMEELASYDRTLVPGILGGASGTTFDAFHQLWEAKKYGARAALYGRMINNSEHQLTFIQHLRWLADGQVTDPAEGVKSYHAALQKLKIAPYRPLADDLAATPRGTAYSAGEAKAAKGKAGPAGKKAKAEDPEFSKMTPAEKVAWNRARWNRILGK